MVALSRWIFVLVIGFGGSEIALSVSANEAYAASKSRSKSKSRRRRPPPRAKKAETPPPAETAPATGSFRGPTRIDFDDRLIQGQTNKSGAVYLFSRKETNISSMVRRRKSFRHLTERTIYDR